MGKTKGLAEFVTETTSELPRFYFPEKSKFLVRQRSRKRSTVSCGGATEFD